MAPPSRHPHTKRLALTLILTIVGGLVVSAGLIIATIFIADAISRSSEKNKVAVDTEVTNVLSAEKIFTLPDNTSNIPESLDSITLVDVVAKNQPAVVRVLTVYCVNMRLTIGTASYSKDNACTAGVGSGSIISRDGFVATNGHVVTISPKQAIISSLDSGADVRTYLSFLVNAKLVAPTQASSILNGVVNGNEASEEALSNTVALIPLNAINTTESESTYAIQLSNEPVRLDRNGERYTVEFSNTITQAKLIDQDFDAESADTALSTGQFTTSDVALLKMNGDFPYVKLGSIDSVKKGDQLTAIGFPAFIDGSVDTDQWQTVPSITQGLVRKVGTDADVNGRVLLTTSVQIAQGNSGGPSFNDAGEQIGINTYSDLECKDLQCFGDGLVRDIADLKKLIERNNITLQTGGVTDDWHQGLDDFKKGNYSDALVEFSQVKADYPANYLAAPLSRLARERSGTASDVSPSLQAQDTITVVFILLGVVVTVIVATSTFLIIYFNYQHRKQSGIG